MHHKGVVRFKLSRFIPGDPDCYGAVHHVHYTDYRHTLSDLNRQRWAWERRHSCFRIHTDDLGLCDKLSSSDQIEGHHRPIDQLHLYGSGAVEAMLIEC